MHNRLFFIICIILINIFLKTAGPAENTGQCHFSEFLGNRKQDNPGKNGTVGKYVDGMYIIFYKTCW